MGRQRHPQKRCSQVVKNANIETMIDTVAKAREYPLMLQLPFECAALVYTPEIASFPIRVLDSLSHWCECLVT